MDNKFNFSSKFRVANIFSLSLFVTSVLFILFKGLNYGIDFKGGTLIELRASSTGASEIRTALNKMDLGDVNVKNFGQEVDYLIKVEQKENDGNRIIPRIKENLSENLKTEINFRRVENVGPKVSSELLQSGVIAISLSLAAIIERLISKDRAEKIPKVITTSWNKAIMDPTLNCHSNLIQI
jgi:preprotein translocase subunit SecF